MTTIQQNVAYVQRRMAGNFPMSQMSPDASKLYAEFVDLTDGWSDLDILEADDEFGLSLQAMVDAMKRIGPQKMDALTKTPRSTDTKPVAAKKPVASKRAATKKPDTKPAKPAPVEVKSSQKKKSQKDRPDTVKPPQSPVKLSPADEGYLAANHVRAFSPALRHLRTYVTLTGVGTKEKVLAALKSLQKAAATQTIRKADPLADTLMAIQQEYVTVLSGKSPYKPAINEAIAKLVTETKVYKSVEILQTYLGWQGNEAVTVKQQKALLAKIRTAKAKGKIRKNDPYAARINELEAALASAIAPTATNVPGTMPVAVGDPVELSGLPVKKRWPDSMSAQELAGINYPTWPFVNDRATNDWKTLFGVPQRPFSAMFSGAPGAGKSTLLMQLATYLARQHGETLYVSSEEYPSLTLADKLQRAGGATPRLSFSKQLSPLANRHKFLIIDSTNHAQLTLAQFLTLKDRYPDLSIILIMQYTKGGQFRGGNEWPHEVDCVFKVEAGVVHTVKNRFVVDPGTIQVFND
jgi:hypothetical protein